MAITSMDKHVKSVIHLVKLVIVEILIIATLVPKDFINIKRVHSLCLMLANVSHAVMVLQTAESAIQIALMISWINIKIAHSNAPNVQIISITILKAINVHHAILHAKFAMVQTQMNVNFATTIYS